MARFRRLLAISVMALSALAAYRSASAQPAAVRDCGSIAEGLNEVAPNRIRASQCLLGALSTCTPARLSHRTTGDEGGQVTTRFDVQRSCEIEVTRVAPEGTTVERCRRASMEATSGGSSILVARDCR